MQKKATTETKEQLEKILKDVFGDFFMEEKDMNAGVKKQLPMTQFAVTKGQMACSMEMGCAGFVRLGTGGTRQIGFARYSDISAYHDKGTVNTPPAKIFGFFKSWNAEQMKAFLKADGKHQLFRATVGSNDLVFCPPGWVFFEKISSGADFTGLRALALNVDLLPAMSELSDMYNAMSKPNELLQQVSDMLVLSSAD